jgi:hypothetical protein
MTFLADEGVLPVRCCQATRRLFQADGGTSYQGEVVRIDAHAYPVHRHCPRRHKLYSGALGKHETCEQVLLYHEYGLTYVRNAISQAGFPLKTIATPNGIYTEQEMFDMLSAISQQVPSRLVIFVQLTRTSLDRYIFDAGVEVELTFDLRNHAAKASRVLLKIIKNQLSSLKSPAVRPRTPAENFDQFAGSDDVSKHAVNRILDDLTHVITGQKDDSNAFLKTVLSTKGNLEELVSEVFAIVVMSTASWAKGTTSFCLFF